METTQLRLENERIIITFTSDSPLPTPKNPYGSIVPIWDGIPDWVEIVERGLLHLYTLTPEGAHALEVPPNYLALDVFLTDLEGGLYAVQASPTSECVGWVELDDWLTITRWWNTLADDWRIDAG
jgi:hypothetical protein